MNLYVYIVVIDTYAVSIARQSPNTCIEKKILEQKQKKNAQQREKEEVKERKKEIGSTS